MRGWEETSQNVFVECCDIINDEKDCKFTSEGNPLVFPTMSCDFVGIAMGKLIGKILLFCRYTLSPYIEAGV